MKKNLLLLAVVMISCVVLAQENEITFQVCDVEENNSPINAKPYLQALEYRINDSDNKIESHYIDETKGNMVACDYHSFMNALYLSFAEHRKITISPDMIWLLICQGFAQHVDINSEELRDKFVEHEGKHKITIRRDNFVKGEQNPWENTFPEFCDSIESYVGKELTDLVIADFSTTGVVETAAFQLTLMDAMDNYFSYGVMTSCGIPSITLKGTSEDWQWILDNIQKFNEYELEWWTSSLIPILQQFVNASKGNIDKEFWQGIYKYVPPGGGSGAVPKINGWIIKFFPYIRKYREFERNPYLNKDEFSREGLTIPNFPSGYSKVDFVWDYFGTEYKMHFIAGFLGITQDSKGNIIPEISWLVKEE